MSKEIDATQNSIRELLKHARVRRSRAAVALFGLLVAAGSAYGQADLSLSVRASSAAFATLPMSLTIVVTNLGPEYASGIFLENQLPEGATVRETEVVHSDGREFPGGCVVGTVGTLTGRVSCHMGSLAPGASATVTIVFTATEGVNSGKSWTFASSPSDPDIGNSNFEFSFTVLPAAAIPTLSPLVSLLLLSALALIARRT